MKPINFVIIAAVAMLFTAPAIRSFAVDGLQLSVQSTNVSLAWPSTEGEIFVVQYRHTLSDTDQWQALAPSLPAATGTNFTSYTHYGIVQYTADSSGGAEFTSASMATTTMTLRLFIKRQPAERMPKPGRFAIILSPIQPSSIPTRIIPFPNFMMYIC